MADSGTYRAPATVASAELRERGSRFLAIVEPARDEDSVRQRIRHHQREFGDASHVCWAWRLGWPAREGRSDAGEPAGTAGSPILQVLQGAGLSDLLVVVIRWFGGVKLGRGGLARAYAAAAAAALAGVKIGMRRSVVKLRVRVPYDRVGELKRLIHSPAVQLLAESYADSAYFEIQVERQHRAEIVEALAGFDAIFESAGN